MTVAQPQAAHRPAPAASAIESAVRARHGTARAGRGELVSAGCALGLLLCMFTLAWFGVIGRSGRLSGVGRLSAEDAWDGMTTLRWLMLLAIIVAVGGLVIHITQSTHGVKTNTGLATLLLCGPVALLVAYRVLIDLPQAARVEDQKLGGYLGVLLAAGMAVGGWRTLHEERERRGAPSG